jgi:hypothetical protein
LLASSRDLDGDAPDSETYADALRGFDSGFGGLSEAPSTSVGVPERWAALYNAEIERVYRREIRREIARSALDALVKDGRIHPASIEEFVQRARDEIDLVTTQAGEDAVTKLNINGLHPEIIKLLGKLKYRFS